MTSLPPPARATLDPAVRRIEPRVSVPGVSALVRAMPARVGRRVGLGEWAA